MNAVRIYAVGVLVSIALSALFFAPFLGLPVGAAISTGGSMGDAGPVLNIYADSEPDVGDVVAFDTGGWGTHDHASHRVIDETENGYVTQGDANEFVDQERGAAYATDENTLGVVLVRVTAFEMFITAAMGAISGTITYRTKIGN